ncbi:PP2C family protein-serine/threonine phosphatase [Streptomyces carpinensis]|uniref:PP2C family protein-serine/threonine phosphatase n=1 Tax=Streptomyces carpinensis TaxID=66369 RepID=A0ABV1W6G4_9ACTN|nr:PP2C family protein-serine/threonine phosphatase [Streptomyces carpinensis]
MRLLSRSARQCSSGGGEVLLRLAQCVPFLIVLLGLGIELSPGHMVYTGPLITAMPALASLTMGPKGTLAAAAGALAVSMISGTLHGAWRGEQVYSNLAGLFVVSLASVTLSRTMQARRQSELDQIRRIAAAAQSVLLRPVPARLGPVRAASMYLAAETGAQIGGDLYEAVQTRYGVRMIVGDVRGKGLPAVRAAAAVLGAFREAAHYDEDLREVMNHCSAALRRESAVEEAAGAEQEGECFVTAVVAQVPDGSVVEVVNRGHPPPMLLRRGRVQALVPGSPEPPLGLEDLVAGPPAEPERYPFLPGDRLLLHTDGVIEARNSANDFFALPEHMESARHARTPREFLEQLHQSLVVHTEDRLVDDVAMVAVDRIG